jgi:pentatricopeptide repeat protein
MRYESLDDNWKIWNLMLAHGILPNEAIYEAFISYLCRQGNLELALQKLSEMGDAGILATLRISQNIITLACEMRYPRLAIELAEAFELTSVRRLDGAVWVKCLIASAEALYVSFQHILS